MGQQAHVSSEVLDYLLSGFQNCATSISLLRGAVDGHVGSCLSEGRSIIEKLQMAEQKAEHRYQRASQAYYSCRDRQKYDKESDSYQPSCKCEERDMNDAEKARNHARQLREHAEYCMRGMELEVCRFNERLGGGGLMDAIVNEYIPEATRRLMALKEKVGRYEVLDIVGVDIGDSSSSNPVLEAPHSTTSIFSRGSDRLRKKMEQNESIFRSYCPKCHCCPCQCDNLLELMRQRTR